MSFDSVKFHGKNKFPGAKFSIVGKLSKQKAPFMNDRIQPILVWKYLDKTPWGFNKCNLTKRIQDDTSDVQIFAEHDSPRHNENRVFQRECLSHCRSLSNSIICFFFVSQF